MKAVRFHETGGPEVLRYEDVDDPTPGAGQALVKLNVSGVNFMDIYNRTGLYPNPLPMIPGGEGAGVVTAIGEGVTGVQVGDRVCFTGTPAAYAEQVLTNAGRLVPIPSGVTDEMACAVILQGLTAHALADGVYHLKPGDKTVVHAGAGGVGLLLIQIAKRLGAQVFTTVSTAEKAEHAKQAGADVVINYTTQDFEEEVKKGYRRPGRPGCVRCSGQDDLPEEPRLPGAHRAAGALRPVKRAGGPHQPNDTGTGLLLPHSTGHGPLHRHQGDAARAG